jgi:hypothetical protein
MYQHRAPPSIEDQGYAGHLTSLPFEEFVVVGGHYIYHLVDNESCWRMISLEFCIFAYHVYHLWLYCPELVVAHTPYNLCTTCNLPMTDVVLVDSSEMNNY